MNTYTTVVTEINASELETIIKQEYNKDYSISHDELECGEYVLRFEYTDTIKKRPLTDFNLKKDLEKFNNNDYEDCNVLYAILIDLCNKDVIPESDYIIFFDEDFDF